MEIIPIVLALILSLSLIILTIMAVFAYARHSFARIEDRYHKSRIRNNKGKGLSDEERQILKSHSSYYNKLEPDSQSHFEQRLRWVIRQKNFIAAGKIKQVKKEMRLYIGSAAIQISFGYPEIYFQSFHSIFVYDDAYLSQYTGKMHHGDVNVKGSISLNWQKIKEGFENPKDGRNLALHEFAHAINIENFIKNEEFRFINASLFHLLKKKWL